MPYPLFMLVAGCSFAGITTLWLRSFRRDIRRRDAESKLSLKQRQRWEAQVLDPMIDRIQNEAPFRKAFIESHYGRGSKRQDAYQRCKTDRAFASTRAQRWLETLTDRELLLFAREFTQVPRPAKISDSRASRVRLQLVAIAAGAVALAITLVVPPWEHREERVKRTLWAPESRELISRRSLGSAPIWRRAERIESTKHLPTMDLNTSNRLNTVTRIELPRLAFRVSLIELTLVVMLMLLKRKSRDDQQPTKPLVVLRGTNSPAHVRRRMIQMWIDSSYGSPPQFSSSLVFLVASIACAAALSHQAMAAEQAPGRVDYRQEIQPLLFNKCLRCHGPDAETREAGLRLDDPASVLDELDSGQRAIVPGNPDESEVMRRVITDDDGERMPPSDAGDPLTDAEIELLSRWIAEGAEYQQHWSFVPLGPVEIPSIADDSLRAWANHPIDRFIAEQLESQQLRPEPEASREILLRRVTLDLTGLPPTLKQLDAFLDDTRPGAYERAVDRLLASPAYGERWGRLWLDLARYADSAGYAQDPPRDIWRYRDWVIQAFNDNLSYADFTIQQLAGDLLPDPSDSQLLATAFHRNTMTNSEGGTDDEEFRSAAIVDRVNTTMQVWMGMTMACAQCHSHKYDPISQQEYFQMYAAFNNTADADRPDEQPLLEEFSPQQLQRKQELAAKLAELENAADLTDEQKKQTKDELSKQLQQIRPVTTPIVRELPADQHRTTYIQLRGNFMNRGDEVTAAVPEAFGDWPEDQEVNRLSVAQWLLAEDNPLTARVAVNRFWEQLFGTGLVVTSEDFGTQGSAPSHPELLNYLAWQFMRGGWDMKDLLREIVTSATYRQSSDVSPEKLAADADNTWLSRGPRFRLPAETVRDQALLLGGCLSLKMYGPSVRPPRPKLGLSSAFGGSTDWETSAGEDAYRRGLYTSWRRTTPYPSMTTFDAPSREVCSIRRIRTNTPLQALVTLNDPVYIRAAQGLARRMLQESDMTVSERLSVGFRICTARYPSASELATLEQLWSDTQTHLASNSNLVAELNAEQNLDASSPDQQLSLATATIVANVLLNLDEVLARR